MEVHTNRFYLSNYPNPFLHTTETRHYLPEAEEVKLSSYDRWGSLIHQTTDPEEGWNGYSNGKLMPGHLSLYS